MTPPLFKEGDVVRLVSGGPAMTVNCRLEPEPGIMLYDCVWFDDKTVSRASFPESALKRVGWFRHAVWD